MSKDSVGGREGSHSIQPAWKSFSILDVESIDRIFTKARATRGSWRSRINSGKSRCEKNDTIPVVLDKVCPLSGMSLGSVGVTCG